MKTKTYLANAIDTADMKAQYDAEAKKIVAPGVLYHGSLRSVLETGSLMEMLLQKR